MFSIYSRNDPHGRTAFLADYRSDIESLPNSSARGTQESGSDIFNNICMAGSRCKVCEDGSVWLLNNQGEWVEQPASSSGSGSGGSGDTVTEITADDITEMWGE